MSKIKVTQDEYIDAVSKAAQMDMADSIVEMFEDWELDSLCEVVGNLRKFSKHMRKQLNKNWFESIEWEWTNLHDVEITDCDCCNANHNDSENDNKISDEEELKLKYIWAKVANESMIQLIDEKYITSIKSMWDQLAKANKEIDEILNPEPKCNKKSCNKNTDEGKMDARSLEIATRAIAKLSDIIIMIKDWDEDAARKMIGSKEIQDLKKEMSSF